ncbi:MAG TPA: ABC transporter permease [Kofleriaceae bacterium]|nr:ABC transporter permease [Kofleriaceae bacterium]
MKLGLGILGAFAVIAIFGPLFVGDPTLQVAVPMSSPSWAHWLGTTGQGQDVLAQLVCGARTSLVIGIFVGLSQIAVGALVGTTAGYFGGWVDDVLTTIVNIFLIMPGLPLMVIIAAYLPTGSLTIALVLVVTGWAWSARVIRAQTLSLRDKDFVLAATVSGERGLRIIVAHIMPNMTSLLVSSFIGATLYAIGAEVALEFLGLGDVSKVTWGTNLFWASNDSALMTGAWWTFVPTGACIALVGFALAMVNGAIDELGNPRLRREDAFLAEAAARGVALGVSTPVLRREA